MCAITAGQRKRSVLVLEGSNKIGKKILMSGGGRCNFTNLACSPNDFISANNRFCISALSRYTPDDFVALVEKHGIAYHEKVAGQLFCDHSSKDILAMLVAECEQAGVTILTHCDISSIKRGINSQENNSQDSNFGVDTNVGHFKCSSLVVATGGLSIPKMGASDFGYRLARQFDVRVLDTRAGLVPFTFTGDVQALTGRLSGLSTNATIKVGCCEFTDDILFTHRGLSGPAALQASNCWMPSSELRIDLLPEHDAAELLLRGKSQQPQALLRTLLSDLLPRALVLELQALWWPVLSTEPLAGIGDEKLRKIGMQLQSWRLLPSGTEGYRTAEVTLGGVDTLALSSKTMEARLQPGLYFIGEVVDVTGQLGGFNFQWAWASGQAAGQAA